MWKPEATFELLWIVRLAATIALFAPLVTPGFSLAELFFSGSILYEEDFCAYSEQPSFVFGAAKNCELLVWRIAALIGSSYLAAFLMLLLIVGFGTMVSSLLDKAR